MMMAFWPMEYAYLPMSHVNLENVTVVAPDRQQSAKSHALSLQVPLRVTYQKDNWYAVDGLPADVVNLALNGLLPQRPQLVLSGVNHGANVADDVTYSGTIGAAMEATLLGVPAIAFSLDDFRVQYLDELRPYLQEVLASLVNNLPREHTLYNVNFPRKPAAIRGLKVTKLARRIYGDDVREGIDPRGHRYYWIGGDVLQSDVVEGSDLDALINQYISLTPLSMDMTNHRLVNELANVLNFRREDGEDAS